MDGNEAASRGQMLLPELVVETSAVCFLRGPLKIDGTRLFERKQRLSVEKRSLIFVAQAGDQTI
jgi:hypothetical protein